MHDCRVFTNFSYTSVTKSARLVIPAISGKRRVWRKIQTVKFARIFVLRFSHLVIWATLAVSTPISSFFALFQVTRSRFKRELSRFHEFFLALGSPKVALNSLDCRVLTNYFIRHTLKSLVCNIKALTGNSNFGNHTQRINYTTVAYSRIFLILRKTTQNTHVQVTDSRTTVAVAFSRIFLEPRLASPRRTQKTPAPPAVGSTLRAQVNECKQCAFRALAAQAAMRTDAQWSILNNLFRKIANLKQKI